MYKTMHKQYILYLLTLTIIFNQIRNEDFEYHLSRGQKMWTGYRHAVHFTDRFLFCSEKLKNTFGAFTSNYQFVNRGILFINLRFMECSL